MEITPTSANVMEYAAIVRDKALLRGVAQAAAEITAMVQEGVGEASEILEAAEQKVYAVRRGQSAQDMVPLRQVLPEALYAGRRARARITCRGSPRVCPRGPEDHGPTNRTWNPAGRPAWHGQDLIGAEHCPEAWPRPSGKTVAVLSLEISREQAAHPVCGSFPLKALIDNKSCSRPAACRRGRTGAEDTAGAATT